MFGEKLSDLVSIGKPVGEDPRSESPRRGGLGGPALTMAGPAAVTATNDGSEEFSGACIALSEAVRGTAVPVDP